MSGKESMCSRLPPSRAIRNDHTGNLRQAIAKAARLIGPMDKARRDCPYSALIDWLGRL